MAGSVQRVDRPSPWRARYRGPDGLEHSRSFSRKVDADRWLRGQLGGVDIGGWVDPRAGDVLYGAWSAGWVAGLHVAAKTVAGYHSLLRSRVEPVFGASSLGRITSQQVRRWVESMNAEGLSAATVTAARQVLHASLQAAVDDGLIARNPVARVKAPTPRPRRQRFLTADQLDCLAAAAEVRSPGAGGLVTLLGWSGLRWGEAAALRVGDVDPGRRRVKVRGAVSEVAGRLVYGDTKTHVARTVILPRFVIEHLPQGGDPGALLFTAALGGPLRHSNWSRRVWKPAVAAAEGIPAGLVIHDLRDTAASLMVASGASVKAVQRALGHASARVTLDVYAGLYEDDLEALADRMEDRFSAAAEAAAAQGGHKGAVVVPFPV